jgi:hypothetical protein
MEYLNNKYVIISLILLLLLFINYNTNDTIKDMIGGGVITTYEKRDINNGLTALMTIQDYKTRNITSIAEFSIPSTNKYDIHIFLNISINSINPFIILCRYNNVGNFIENYTIYKPTNTNITFKDKFYNSTRVFKNMELNSGDILKIIVPFDVKLIEQPIMFYAISRTNYDEMLNYFNYKNPKLSNEEKKLLEKKLPEITKLEKKLPEITNSLDK